MSKQKRPGRMRRQTNEAGPDAQANEAGLDAQTNEAGA